MIGFRQANRVIGIISTAILARLLLPDDFGLVAYAMTFFAIVALFFEFGVETVLIRDRDAGADSYNTAWTLECMKGVLLATIMYAGAGSVADFFNEPRVEEVLQYLAALPLLQGIKNIGVVDFQKKMEFDKEFIFKFVPRVAGVTTTISLAFILRNHWALVIGMLTNNTVALLLSYTMCSFRPRFGLSKFSRVFGFTKWLIVQNVATGLNDRLPILILGRFAETRVVGHYNMGFELSMLASGEFAAPIRRVLFPGVAAIANDENRMVKTIISAIGLIALVGLPATIGIAITAPILVPLFLGDNWNDIVPIMQVLVVNGIAIILQSNSYIIFYSADKPILTAYMSILRLVLLVPALLYLTPQFGAIGAAWALSGTNVFVIFIEYIQMFRMVDIRIRDVIDALWRTLISAVAMGLATHYFMAAMTGWDADLRLVVQLLLTVSVGIVSYAAAVISLWLATGRPDGAESYVLNVLGHIKRRFVPGTS